MTDHRQNITLIGMPGAGKSTVGIILAKDISFGFIDTDVLIQINNGKSLQEIIDESDYMNLRRVEEREILKLNISGHVIATGGSAVYSKKGMSHLKEISGIIFLDVTLETCRRRIRNFDTRGIAKRADQSLNDLFRERRALYEQYADYTVDCNDLSQEEIAWSIADRYNFL